MWPFFFVINTVTSLLFSLCSFNNTFINIINLSGIFWKCNIANVVYCQSFLCFVLSLDHVFDIGIHVTTLTNNRFIWTVTTYKRSHSASCFNKLAFNNFCKTHSGFSKGFIHLLNKYIHFHIVSYFLMTFSITSIVESLIVNWLLVIR